MHSKKEGDEMQQNICKSILASANSGFLVVQNSKIVFHNPYYLKLTGYSSEEIETLDFIDIVHPKDKKLIKLLFADDFKEIRTKSSQSYTYRISHKSGELRWLKSNVSLIEWNGKLALVDSCFDITAQKEFEQNFLQEEQNFKLLVNSLDDMVFILSQKATIIQGNRTVYEKLKLPEQELVLRSFEEFNLQKDKNSLKDSVTQASEGKRVGLISLLKGHRGKTIPVEIRFFSGLWSQKQVVFAVCQDISERIEAEKVIKLSEEKFSKAFETSAAMMAISTFNEGRYIDVNETFLEKTGLTREEIIGHRSIDIRLYSEINRREELKTKMLRGEKIRNIETIVIHKSGQPLTCLFSSEIIYIQEKPCMLVVMNDITERKKSEERIQQSEQRFRQLAELLPEMVFEANAKGIITFANDYLLSLFELSEKEVINKLSISKLFESNSKLIVQNYLCHALSVPEFHSIELIAQKTNALTFPVLTHILATQTKGKVDKFMGILVDITERKEQELELVKAKELAEEASRAKEQFLSVMSHEIRTPMNAIIGTTNLLFQEDPLERQMGYLKALKFSAENLLVLLNDILDFSKIEAGKFQIHNTTFNLHEIAEGVFSTFETVARQKGITLELQFDKTIPQAIVGDPIRINQILANLISNSLKFTEKGTVTLKISSNRETKTHRLINFSVTDSGIGIPKDKVDDIFKEFSQVYSKKNHRYGGTGLGLTISKRLVELMGGNLELKTSIGQGSEFYFSLKLKKTSKKVELPEKQAVKNDVTITGYRILVAEDNEINAMIALKFLNTWGAIADLAINGQQAVAKVSNNTYDLVLMDLEMPIMNGYEATKAIRELSDKKKNSIPIVALTASAMIDVRSRIKDTGMDGFILKPFKPSDLLDKIIFFANKK